MTLTSVADVPLESVAVGALPPLTASKKEQTNHQHVLLVDRINHLTDDGTF